MVDGWTCMTLGDFVTLQRGHDLPEQDRRPGTVPILGSFGVTGFHDVPRARGPGVSVGRSGASFGVVAYSPVDFWPLNTALYVVDFHGNGERFAYYLLKQIDFQGFNSGSAQPSLNRNYVHPIPVEVPPVPEQRAIAQFFGALDDKIELIRRMNETLEGMARALFKSWFVDFDPVRARAEGHRPAGMDGETARLFPSSFVESKLGKIPKTWTVRALGDVAGNPRRGVDPTALATGTPYIGLEHMPRKSIALGEWGQSDSIGSNKFRFAQGEILFGKLRPYFHKVGVAVTDGVCSTDILVIVPKEPQWFAFVLAHVSSDELIQHADATSTGTKMPRTNWEDLARFQVVTPSDAVACAFDGRVRPMTEVIRANIHQSLTLAALRDALLPKLLSGAIRVKDAERFVGART